MNWIAAIFGIALIGYGVGHGHGVMDQMRPYAAVIGAVLFVTAMILTAVETSRDNQMLRRAVRKDKP